MIYRRSNERLNTELMGTFGESLDSDWDRWLRLDEEYVYRVEMSIHEWALLCVDSDNIERYITAPLKSGYIQILKNHTMRLYYQQTNDGTEYPRFIVRSKLNTAIAK